MFFFFLPGTVHETHLSHFWNILNSSATTQSVRSALNSGSPYRDADNLSLDWRIVYRKKAFLKSLPFFQTASVPHFRTFTSSSPAIQQFQTVPEQHKQDLPMNLPTRSRGLPHNTDGELPQSWICTSMPSFRNAPNNPMGTNLHICISSLCKAFSFPYKQ